MSNAHNYHLTNPRHTTDERLLDHTYNLNNRPIASSEPNSSVMKMVDKPVGSPSGLQQVQVDKDVVCDEETNCHAQMEQCTVPDLDSEQDQHAETLSNEETDEDGVTETNSEGCFNSDVENEIAMEDNDFYRRNMVLDEMVEYCELSCDSDPKPAVDDETVDDCNDTAGESQEQGRNETGDQELQTTSEHGNDTAVAIEEALSDRLNDTAGESQEQGSNETNEQELETTSEHDNDTAVAIEEDSSDRLNDTAGESQEQGSNETDDQELQTTSEHGNDTAEAIEEDSSDRLSDTTGESQQQGSNETNDQELQTIEEDSSDRLMVEILTEEMQPKEGTVQDVLIHTTELDSVNYAYDSDDDRRPFACDECHKRYVQKSSLSKHKKLIHRMRRAHFRFPPKNQRIVKE